MMMMMMMMIWPFCTLQTHTQKNRNLSFPSMIAKMAGMRKKHQSLVCRSRDETQQSNANPIDWGMSFGIRMPTHLPIRDFASFSPGHVLSRTPGCDLGAVMFGPLFERGVGMLERLLFVWDLDGVARGGAHGPSLCLRNAVSVC